MTLTETFLFDGDAQARYDQPQIFNDETIGDKNDTDINSNIRGILDSGVVDMTEISTSTKYWKDKYRSAVSSLVALGAIALILLAGVGALLSRTQPVVVLEKPAFDFNGQRCTTLRQEPEFIYRVDKQTVTLTIECSPEIMLHYFEAAPEQDNERGIHK